MPFAEILVFLLLVVIGAVVAGWLIVRAHRRRVQGSIIASAPGGHSTP